MFKSTTYSSVAHVTQKALVALTSSCDLILKLAGLDYLFMQYVIVFIRAGQHVGSWSILPGKDA